MQGTTLDLELMMEPVWSVWQINAQVLNWQPQTPKRRRRVISAPFIFLHFLHQRASPRQTRSIWHWSSELANCGMQQIANARAPVERHSFPYPFILASTSIIDLHVLRLRSSSSGSLKWSFAPRNNPFSSALLLLLPDSQPFSNKRFGLSRLPELLLRGP